MPLKDGFAVARAARELCIAVPLVFLTMHKDEHYLHAALDLGVKGYVLKDSAVTEIVSCLKAVVTGRDYVSPALSSYLIRRSARAAALAAEPRARTTDTHRTPHPETDRRGADQSKNRGNPGHRRPHRRTSPQQHRHETRTSRQPRAGQVRHQASIRTLIWIGGWVLGPHPHSPAPSVELPIRIRRTTDGFFAEPSIHAAR